MKELCFAQDGVVIGDRDKHEVITMSYGNMFKIIHEFLNEINRNHMIITGNRKVRFQRLKEGDGSPYPIMATGDDFKPYQLKYDEIIGIDKDWGK